MQGKPAAGLLVTEDLEETIEFLADADAMRRLHASETEVSRDDESRDELDAVMARRLRTCHSTTDEPGPHCLESTAPDRAGSGTGTIGGVCTVVVRWSRGAPARVLALRDELTSREFDDPGRWWTEHPAVVGGRDRLAGGTWCATHVDTGVTALVLNRPQKRVADPGAPSRGALPLLGAEHGADWLSAVRLDGMASFLLVLVTPDRLTTWDFDGGQVVTTEHPEGTWMVTSGGPEDRKADRFLPLFAEAGYPDGWRRLVQSEPPRDDPGALVVHHEQDGLVFATVFGEFIDARPGRLRLEYSRRPWLVPWHSLAVG